MRPYYIALLAFIFLGVAYAGTVTLTGTCTYLQRQGMINFTIANSGNDTAYSMAVIPFIKNARADPAYYTIRSLGPGQSNESDISLGNITMDGSYVDYFLVGYQQGSQSFFSVFPCMVNFGRTAVSLVQIIGANVTSSQGAYNITAEMINEGHGPIDANVTIILPPTFAFANGSSRVLELAPLKIGYVKFGLEGQGGIVSVQGVISAQYIEGNESYSAMRVISIVPNVLHTSPLIIEMAPILIIVVLVILLAAFIILRRNFRKKMHAHKADA